jgi:hypothetical protein
MGAWLLNEDNALRTLLSDITVSDEHNSARKVGVWFGQPDVEIRTQAYPYITIDLIDAREATERSMRGRVTLGYQPDGAAAPTVGKGYVTDYPIPYDLDYQVTTYARQPRHDRSIMRTLMQEKFGSRMHTLYIPEDDTQRSMFLIGSQKRDSTEQNKRLFSNAYTVRIYSELLPKAITELPVVSSVAQSVQFSVDALPAPLP